MNKFKMMVPKFCLIAFPILVQACATITVNVYFPAEEVREAYINLEEELLRPQKGDEPLGWLPPASEESVAEPESRRRYGETPLLKHRRFIRLRKNLSLNLSNFAWAQDDIAGEITKRIRNMPPVVRAFQDRGKRLGAISKLLSDRKAGEGNRGLLVASGDLSREESNLLSSENRDRGLIIEGMARAIVEINGMVPTSENVDRVVPEAAAQFAAVRRSEAKAGWAIQLPDGSWVTKK